MSASPLAGQTTPMAGTPPGTDEILGAFSKAGGAPSNHLIAANPRSTKAKKKVAPVAAEEGPPGPTDAPQKYTSAGTSINKAQVPAVFSKVPWQKGTKNIDIGGGKYDTGTDYLKGKGVENAIYDPHNRPPEHNKKVDKSGHYHTATVSNVLNVIQEPHIRHAVLQKAHDALKPGGKAHISVYEGDQSGEGRQTGKDQWQENRRLHTYLDEVKRVFPKAALANGMITAEKAAPEVSPDVVARIGERPTDSAQAAVYDKIATRMGKGKEFDEGIPLVPSRKDTGEFKTESDKETPVYQKHHYDIVHAPMLGDKALKRNEKGTVETPDVKDTSVADEFKYLGDADRKRLSHLHANGAVDAYADKLHDEFQSVKDNKQIMAAKGWYTQAAKDLIKHFGKHADLMAQLLAATSPQQGVVQNFKDALEAYNRFRRGDFDDKIKLYRQAHDMHSRGELVQHLHDSGIAKQMFDTGKIKKMPTTGAEAMAAWIKHHDLVPKKSDNKTKYGLNSDKVMKVLASTWLATSEGPKTRNYTGNLSGKTLQATIDMWAARTMRRLGYQGHTDQAWLIHPPQEHAVKDLDFAFSQLAFRKAAEKAGLTPHDLQAILWYKEQYDWKNSGKSKTGPEEKDYRPLLKAYKAEHAKGTKEHYWEPGMPIETGLGGR